MPPLLALALLASAALLATRLPRPATARSATVDLLLAGGTPLILLGIVLGPGIGALDQPTLAGLAPVTALAIGWVGARLGARCEWRLLRRVPKETWGVVAAQAVAGMGAGFVAAWLGAKLVPALAAAWTPRLAAALTLGAVAIIPGARPMERAARAGGMPARLARRLRRVALLDAACGTLVFAIGVGLGHARVAGVLPGWLVWLAAALGAGVLISGLFLVITRLAPECPELGFALFAVLVLGAALGYAADLSPFVVCAIAAALLVNVSASRRRVRALLASWEGPTYPILLILAGAGFVLPTLWILAAAPVLGVLRLVAQWSTVRSGLAYLPQAALPPNSGLASLAQGGAAIALGLSFALAHGTGALGGGAVLTTILLGVLLTHAAAPAVMRLALATSAGAATLAQPSAGAPVEG